MTNPYPLRFRPIFKEKVWGGRAFEALGKKLPPGNIGESWELTDLDSTSVSGGGGSPEHSIIENGPLAGKTIRDAVKLWGGELLGSTSLTHAGAFPLLVKFLDAREHLSIQVHPSPGYAAAHPAAHLKTECWYILHTQPVHGQEPVIFKGLRPGVTRTAFEAAIREGRVPEVMQSFPAIVGECHNLPSGTIHALGAGVVVAEVQTPSDTTFRVYDWAKEYGRSGRELHVDQTLACTDFGPPPPVARLEPGQKSGRIVSTEFFRVHEWRLNQDERRDFGLPPRRAHVLVILKGLVAMESIDRAFPPLSLPAGSTALVPAAILKSALLRADAETTLLIVDVG